MSFLIEVVRGRTWKPKQERGKRVWCETEREAEEALRQLLTAGEASVRAVNGRTVTMLACAGPDGAAIIASRHELPPTC